MLTAILALALLGAPSSALLKDDHWAQIEPTWAYEDELEKGPKAELRVRVTLPPEQQLRVDEAQISVRVRIYPPKGVFSHPRDAVQKWEGGTLAFDVPSIYDLGIVAGSRERGYVEQRLPALGLSPKVVGEQAKNARLELVLPRQRDSTEVTVRGVFPPGSGSPHSASLQFVLPITGIAVAQDRLTVEEPEASLALPHGRYEVQIEPQILRDCGNGRRVLHWACSSIRELVCEGGGSEQLTHSFTRGSSFNVRFLAPAGMEQIRVHGTLRCVDPTKDEHLSLKGSPRDLVWASMEDSFSFPYLSTTANRVVYPCEVFAPGEYVLSISGESLETQELPVTISLEAKPARSFPRAAPIDVQLVQK